jgi:hypothetical protein
VEKEKAVNDDIPLKEGIIPISTNATIHRVGGSRGNFVADPSLQTCSGLDQIVQAGDPASGPEQFFRYPPQRGRSPATPPIPFPSRRRVCSKPAKAVA